MLIPRVRPVRRQRRPVYPTRPEVARDPELLRRHTPSAWRKSTQVTAALSILIASGCNGGGNPKGGKAEKVAPVFEHGEGRGVVGCVMVTPPVFVSEEEALQLISDELGRVGLTMSKQNVTLDRVLVPRVIFTGFDPKTQQPKREEKQFPLVVDLMDPVKSVAVEFVGTQDCLQLGGEPARISIQDYDCRGVAAKVGEVIRQTRKAPRMHYGLFYDPMLTANMPPKPKPETKGKQEPVNPTGTSNSLEVLGAKLRNLAASVEVEDKAKTAAWQEQCRQVYDDAKKESLELLRAQVKDFIEWLKGQGTI